MREVTQKIAQSAKETLWFTNGELTTELPSKGSWIYEHPENINLYNHFNYIFSLTHNSFGSVVKNCESYKTYLKALHGIDKYFKIVQQTKIKLTPDNISKVIPVSPLKEYLKAKEDCLREIIGQQEELPENYEWFKRLYVLSKVMNNSLKLVEGDKYSEYSFKYDIHGTLTGRWIARSSNGSFFQWPKERRAIIKPWNDYFVELDFNGADLRTLLGLQNASQPSQDVHKYNMSILGWDDREKAKKGAFRLLYGRSGEDNELTEIYDRNVWRSYVNSKGLIENPYGRQLDIIEGKELPHLVQATSHDILLEQTMRVYKKLMGSKSFVGFIFYDALILDMKREDLGILKDLEETFADTRFGTMKVNIKKGTDYYNMEEI